MKPEMRLLLLCLRAKLTVETEDEIRRLVAGPLGWNALFGEAARHCSTALLHTRLNALCPELVPPDVLATLQARFRENFGRNLLLTGELVRLLGRFEARHIPVVSYKGPVLASFYENLGSREFGDLDLLVRREDVQRADELLQGFGFRPYMFKPCPQQERALPFARRFHFEMSYINEAGDTPLDLHWALMPGFYALPKVAESVWERLEPVMVAGKKIRTLSPEDTVLFTCLHGTKHIWERLGWVRDVAILIEKCPGLDWGSILDRAVEFRMKRALLLGLRLAVETLGAEVPEQVRAPMYGDASLGPLIASIRKKWFEDPLLYTGTIASCVFYVRSREAFGDAIRCSAERIFQPTMAEWESVPLPRALYSLYYLLRPARLLGKYVWGE